VGSVLMGLIRRRWRAHRLREGGVI